MCITIYSLVDVYQCFAGTFFLYLQDARWKQQVPPNVGTVYQTARCQIPKDQEYHLDV
jgi:hypothetical protein